MRRLLLCLFLLSASLGTWAQIWTYTVSDGKATITGTTQTTGTDLNIPNQVVDLQGTVYPVTAIGNRAFYGKSGFTGSLTIPAGVTSIGDGAFNGCSKLTGSLTIPAGVTSIGTSAFYNCSGFTGSLTIPESVTSIGAQAFSRCSKLTGSLTIPKGVKIINNQTFYNCSGLTGPLIIPEGVDSIGMSAFQSCKGFTGSLKIPAGVKHIAAQTFNGCSGLDGSLTLPPGVITIGQNAFIGCSKLTGSLTLPESVKSIGRGAFSSCSGLTGSLTIPASVTSIGNGAFLSCSGFTGPLTIPASVTSIGDDAFRKCSGLSSLTFAPNTNITLGNGLFNSGVFLNLELRYIDASSLPASLFSNVDVATKFGKNNYTLLYLPEGSTTSSDVPNVVIGNTCQSLRLYDNSRSGAVVTGANGYGQSGYEYGNAIIKAFTATSAVYTDKRLEDNGVYTLYLPYEINLPAEIEAYTLLSYGSKTAVFTKYTGTLQAYTPYLLKRVQGSGTQTLDNTTMSGVAVEIAPDYLANPNAGSVTDANTGEWKFLGTTNPISNADAEKNRLYVLEADNTWRPVKSANSAGYVRSLRAFLQAPANYSGAPLAFMIDEEDTTTGLETIEAEVKKENVDIYTVEGRFVGRNYESLPSGLYIIGGKKVYKF